MLLDQNNIFLQSNYACVGLCRRKESDGREEEYVFVSNFSVNLV